jgi:hypothetical protein
MFDFAGEINLQETSSIIERKNSCHRPQIGDIVPFKVDEVELIIHSHGLSSKMPSLLFSCPSSTLHLPASPSAVYQQSQRAAGP